MLAIENFLKKCRGLSAHVTLMWADRTGQCNTVNKKLKPAHFSLIFQIVLTYLKPSKLSFRKLGIFVFLCKSLGTVKLLLKICSFVVSASVDLLIFRFHSKMFYNIKIRIQKVVVVGGVPFDDNSCCTKWSHFSATRLIQIGRIRCIQLSNFIRCSSGSGCGPVGRTAAFTMRNSRFESSHQHILVTVNIVEKTKKRKEVDYYTMLSARMHIRGCPMVKRQSNEFMVMGSILPTYYLGTIICNQHICSRDKRMLVESLKHIDMSQ